METISIEIENPKAKRILKELAELNLININPTKKDKQFSRILNKLRNKSAPSVEEISKEVEIVRTK